MIHLVVQLKRAKTLHWNANIVYKNPGKDEWLDIFDMSLNALPILIYVINSTDK